MTASALEVTKALQQALHQTAVEASRQAALARQGVAQLAETASSGGLSTAGEDALRYTAKLYGIPTRHRQLKHMVANLTDVLLDDIGRIRPDPHRTVRVFAASSDFRSWSTAGIVPRSAYHESAESLHLAHGPSASTQRQDIQQQLLRCKLASAFSGILVSDMMAAILHDAPLPTPDTGLPADVKAIVEEVNGTLAQGR